MVTFSVVYGPLKLYVKGRVSEGISKSEYSINFTMDWLSVPPHNEVFQLQIAFHVIGIPPNNTVTGAFPNKGRHLDCVQFEPHMP